MVWVSFKIYFTPLGRHTSGTYRCSSNGRAAFIILCFGLQHLQQAAVVHWLGYLYKPVRRSAFLMNPSIFRIDNVVKKKKKKEAPNRVFMVQAGLNPDFKGGEDIDNYPRSRGPCRFTIWLNWLAATAQALESHKTSAFCFVITERACCISS